MDRVAPDNYSQSDPSSAAQYPSHQEVRAPANYQPATPSTDYNATPASARSANFAPEYLARNPQYAPGHPPQGTMAQAPNPSITAPSPTYPGPYSPYAAPPQDMSQYPGHHPQYAQWPPGAYHPHPGMHYSPSSAVSAGGSPATAGPRGPGQVYSFVPIPGAQQHKRPRRRYEEIERMYKCGHNGCEKAYGTLNHLNAHVTMQGHGSKRTPEEFKEIRKEWKARKKEEDNARKAEEERQRQQMGAAPGAEGAVDPTATAQTPTSQNYATGVRPPLPPLGYAPAGGQVAGHYPSGAEMYPQGNGQIYSTYNNPNSPYAPQPGHPMYPPHNDSQNNYGAP